MVLAGIADLMFSSRVRAAAAGRPGLRFARSASELLAAARAERPSLILLDLNAAPLDPLATITALKSDPDLAGIRVVGFVSHVQSDVIAAARHAGIDEVMARSAFTASLPALLAP
jgi:CheY-like chemotaxis protein